MSGAFPANARIPSSPALIRSYNPTRVSTAHSMKENTRSRGGQRFGFRLSWVNLTREEYQLIDAFLSKQRGQFESFTIVLPIHSTPLGSWAGVPVVNGANQSGRSLSVSGFTALQTVAKAGDFFKLTSGTKVYKLTEDAASDAVGIATLVFEPALMVTPGNGEAIVKNNVPFTVRLTSDNLESPLRSGAFYDIDVDVIERI